MGSLYISKEIYATQYGKLYQISGSDQDAHPDAGRDAEDANRVQLASYDQKIVKILEVGEQELFYFLEDGRFRKLTSHTSNRNLPDAASVLAHNGNLP